MYRRRFLKSSLFRWREKLYCSGCGSRLIEQQLDGRLRPACPACGRVAYRQLKVGAGALIERDGALLLVQRGPDSGAFVGTWNLPAGYCEADEPPRVTAAREAFEETGLRVRTGRLVDAYFFDDDPRCNGLLLVYEAEGASDPPANSGWQPEGRGEVAAAGFFPPDGLPQPLCGGGHDRAIEAWRRRSLDRWQPGMAPRHCPHCTHRLEERQAFGRSRLACPACGFVHFRELKVGVSVLVEQEGQVLLIQRAIEPGLGKWALPSGFVEWDEPPEAAAARECLEETGLVVKDLEMVDVLYYTEDFRGPGLNLAYSARIAGGRLEPGDDAGAARWFSPATLPPQERLAFPSHVAALDRWRKRGSHPSL